MNIEDFKKIVAGYEIGDELKLEELCAKWNEDLIAKLKEQLETQLDERDDRIAELHILHDNAEYDREVAEKALAELLERQT
jgi:hypothetical protein